MRLEQFHGYRGATTTNMKDTRHIIVVESYFSNEAHWYSVVFENSESHFKL